MNEQQPIIVPPIQFESKHMFEAANRASLALIKLTQYFEQKYQLDKVQATALTACYLNAIPTQIETDHELEEGILEIVRELKQDS